MISYRWFRWIIGVQLLVSFPEVLYIHRRLTASRHGQIVGIPSPNEANNLTYVVDNPVLFDVDLREDDIHEQTTEISKIQDMDDETEDKVVQKSSTSIYKTGGTKYLFPVHFWEGGPNWNYLSFRRDIAYAITHNRTLVTIPFHNHHILGWEKGWRSFKNTFDVGKLRELVPLVSPAVYKEDCNASMELLIQFTLSQRNTVMRKYFREQYERTRKDFIDLWDINLPDTSHNRRNKTELAGQVKVADSVYCLGINGPLQIRDLHIPNESELLKVVDEYFKPAEYIRNMADYVTKNICNMKPFVAIHWRNRTGEACEFGMVLNGAEACAERMPLLTTASARAADAVSELMKNHTIDCVYVAAPPRQQAFVDHLRQRVSRVFTAKDIVLLDKKVIQKLQEDNYKLSLVEQEFCAKADIFLSCGKSNWSDFVRNRRSVHNKETSYLRDLPGVPKEIYDWI